MRGYGARQRSPKTHHLGTHPPGGAVHRRCCRCPSGETPRVKAFRGLMIVVGRGGSSSTQPRTRVRCSSTGRARVSSGWGRSRMSGSLSYRPRWSCCVLLTRAAGSTSALSGVQYATDSSDRARHESSDSDPSVGDVSQASPRRSNHVRASSQQRCLLPQFGLAAKMAAYG